MKKNWEVKKLGEVCVIVNGGTPDTKIPEYWNGDNLWITPKDMGKLDSIYVDDTERKLTESGLKNSSAKVLPINSIILSSRAPIGHLAINKKEISTNQGCKGIIPNKVILTLYAFYFFKKSVQLLDSLGSGTTFKELSGSTLAKVNIPIPPISEQKRIVAILNEAFEAIERAKENAEKNLKNARELLESYLQSIFTQRGEGWVVKKIREVANHSLGKMLDKAKNKGEFKPYLRNMNVRWFTFDLSDLLLMPFLPEELAKYTAVKGDVLICEGGYPGRAAIWTKDSPIYFQKALHRVRFHEPEYNKWFLYYLYSEDKSGKLKQHFSGTGIQHFTGESLARFELPLPPLPELRRLIDKIDALSTETKKLEAIYNQKLTDLEELKKSILQKAFNGEL